MLQFLTFGYRHLVCVWGDIIREGAFITGITVNIEIFTP